MVQVQAARTLPKLDTLAGILSAAHHLISQHLCTQNLCHIKDKLTVHGEFRSFANVGSCFLVQLAEGQDIGLSSHPQTGFS